LQKNYSSKVDELKAHYSDARAELMTHMHNNYDILAKLKNSTTLVQIGAMFVAKDKLDAIVWPKDIEDTDAYNIAHAACVE